MAPPQIISSAAFCLLPSQPSGGRGFLLLPFFSAGYAGDMIRALTFASLAGAMIAVVCGVACHLTKAGPPIAIWVAAFLIFFGLSKGLVAVERLAELQAMKTGGPDPRAGFASPFIFWAYIVTKFTVWTVAWVVGGYLFAHPMAFIAR